MFLNRLCWWTSVLSFLVFVVGFASQLLGVLFIPIPEMTEWMLHAFGPLVGCAVLAYSTAGLYVAERADADATVVGMDPGNIASGVLAAVIGLLATALCAVVSYFLMMGVLVLPA